MGHLHQLLSRGQHREAREECTQSDDNGAGDFGNGDDGDGEEFKHNTSSLEDEVDSTSSRDINFSARELDKHDKRMPSKKKNKRSNRCEVTESDNSDDEGDGDGDRTPQYRHSVTTNWSSSDEETENYRDHRSSLFQRRSETSSPDYFAPGYSAVPKGD